MNKKDKVCIPITEKLNARIQNYAWKKYGKYLLYEHSGEGCVTFQRVMNDLLLQGEKQLKMKKEAVQ